MHRVYSLTQLTSSLPLHTVSIILQHANIVLSTHCCTSAKQLGFEGCGNVFPFSLSQSRATFTGKNLTDRRINYLFIPQIFSINLHESLLNFLCSLLGVNFYSNSVGHQFHVISLPLSTNPYLSVPKGLVNTNILVYLQEGKLPSTLRLSIC